VTEREALGSADLGASLSTILRMVPLSQEGEDWGVVSFSPGGEKPFYLM